MQGLLASASYWEKKYSKKGFSGINAQCLDKKCIVFRRKKEGKKNKKRTQEDENAVLGQSTSGLGLGKKSWNNAKTACLDGQPVHCIARRSIQRKEPVGR